MFDEIVDSTNSNKAGGLSGLVAKTSWGDFTYAGGADTNVLYFKGTVPAGASGKITVNSITGADKIKDMCDTSGTASSGTGSAVVTVDTKTPTVAITNTSLTNGSASGRITATNFDTLQYAWSQEETMPVAGWFTCKSGDTVSSRQTSGKWYLHALATYEGTGATAYTRSSVFDFGTPEQPTFPLPELTVTTDNSQWTNGSRTINITKKPADATVKVTTPAGTTSTLSSTAATYAAQTNGLYTFTLTSGGETVVQDIAVEKIDKIKPDVTLTEAGMIGEDGSASGIYNTLTMAAKAEDVGTASEIASGIKTVQYAFSTSASAPTSTSAWTTAGTSDKLADGRYSFRYTATQTAQTKMYLYVKVTDNAGNVTTVCSAAYTVIQEPAASGKPALTLTAASTAWTKGDVTLTWKVTNGGAGNCTVNAGGEQLTGKETNDTGTFKVQKNGMYMVSVSDVNGSSATASIVVNNIDKEAPVLDKLTVSPAGYKASKTVTLKGADDILTTQYNEKGVSGKSGSGIKTREYQLVGDSSWKTFTGNSITVSKAGTCKVRLTDNAENVSEVYSVEVTGIDVTAPVLTAIVNATPKASNWYTDSTVPVTLAYKDEAGEEGPASGIKSVEYAFTTTMVKPTILTSLGSSAVASGSAVINLTNNGNYYLYCRVTDQAGNVKEGWRFRDGSLRADAATRIQKDSYKGSVTISGPAESKPASDGLTMRFDVSYGPSGGRLSGSGFFSNFAAHAGPGTKSGTDSYNTKTTGTNYVYFTPTSWGEQYYWTYYVRKVTFDSQGGSKVPDHVVWTKQASTSTSTAVDCKLTKPADPTRTGYIFGGWYTDAACSEGKEFDFANQTQIRTDTTLYAKWTAVNYQVNYHLGVPQRVSSNSDPYTEADYTAPANKTTYTYGQKMTLPTPTLPSGVTGFKFDGWYTNADYTGTRYTQIPETAAKDMDYYGQFKDVEAPSLSYAGSSTSYNRGWYKNITYTYRISDDNRQSARYEILRDGEIVREENITAHGKRSYTIYLKNYNAVNYILEGDHTYQIRAWDTAGNMNERTLNIKYDPTAPTYGNITYSAAPVIKFTNGTYIRDTKYTSAYQEIKVFGEVPTISIPVQDKPGAGANASSGLWKLTYTKTTLKTLTGDPDGDPETVTIDLTGQGEDGMVKITLPDNWRGTITDITLYDQAGNTASVGEIGEVLVDTVPPRIVEFKLVNGTSGAYYLEDRWYTTEELNDKNILKIGALISDNLRISSYRWLVNGKEGTEKTWQGTANNVYPDVNIADYTGVNTFTVEVTDSAGHTTTGSWTLRIKGPEGSKVPEQTPAAVCDYPADAIAQLAPNTQYALTVDGTTYNVTTDGQGRIPFELPISGNSTKDICGKTVSIVKKGDGTNTEDSVAQELTIKARPDPLADDKATVVPELLKEADDARIDMTIDSGNSYTWEYSTDNGQNWKEVPENGTITNLPKGDILLRAKAKANTSASANDGWPHGKQSTKNIKEGTGKITVHYDRNGGTSGPNDQTGYTYKSTLNKPSDPSRSGYEFMGWYRLTSDYQPGGSTDKAWRFKGTEKAQIVGELLGTDRTAYQDSYDEESETYIVTLYAGWRENVPPTLTPVLKDGSNSTLTDTSKWYPDVSISLTYSDNVGITKLYVKKDDGAYTVLSGNGIGNGTAGQSYTLNYEVEEGDHTYTFKAEDAAGNVTEKTVTAKLDQTAPVFGEATFNSGYKHLWDWIIRKDSLIITIPVTEGGSGIADNGVAYTLTPASGTATTGTAKMSGSASAGYKAQITIPATFKGKVEITATDKAGNGPATMQIGADGSGIEGVIVESSAPVVTVLADRGISDETATASSAANGVAVDTKNYYNSAPGLFVTVTDKDLDGGQTAAGLASITWKIGGGAENPVGADYLGAGSNGPLTTHSFTIGGLEGSTGEVTVTITATDQAGNETTHKVTLHIKGKMPLPAPTVDYIGEKLTGLTAKAKYSIGGEEISAGADGSIAIKEAWFGSDLSLYRKTDNAATTLDSDVVQITLNARPDAPGVTKTDETIKAKQDGKLHNLDTTMEYSKDGGKTWTAVQAGDLTGGVMENLPAGEILVRVKAKANSTGMNDGAPHGQPILAQIEEGTPLTVTFDTNGGSDLAPITDLSWNDTVIRPKDPVKEGYAVAGWYQEAGFNNEWYFDGETNADVLNADKGITVDNPGITLYAKWTDDESPALTAQLTDSARAAVSEKEWYNSLAVVLTYSDNEAVTKLYVKKDSEAAYTEIAGQLGTENGKDGAGNTRYQYLYTDLTEGEHTYTFKAVDAAGKETEAKLTAKLDTTEPAFGTASYEEGHKNLWNWIIRKESLLITIPVTEKLSGVDTVEYILTPADSTADTITGTAKVSGNQSAGYTATISVASDFKGTVKIKGSDKAGNMAGEKTIGTDGNGANGVIVEDDAPQITVLADRLPSEATAGRPEGTMLSADALYDNAPGLVVLLTDDGDGDDSVITSGLALVKYKAGSSAEKTVDKDYDTESVTQDTFTIPDTETQAGAGATSVTVTVTAVDQAGNTATKTVTIQLKSREKTPETGIGYVAETLTGLKADTVYIINDMGLESDAAGTIAINGSWFDTDITVVLPGNRETTVNSTAQTIKIPARPAAPVGNAGNASYPGAKDGTITLTAPAAGTTYEISSDGGETWKNAVFTGTQITGLAAGDYQIRVKAVEGKNFKSDPTAVTVEETPPTPYPIPTARIDYRMEILTGLEPNAEYELTYRVPEEEDGEDSSGEEGDGEDDEEETEPPTITVKTDENGTIKIKEEWMGETFHIVRKGNGKDKSDSAAQILPIPVRPEPPTPTGVDVDRNNPAELAKLKDLKPNTKYDVSSDGGKTWETKTSDGSGVIKGLDAPETYKVRVSATDSSFASKPSGDVEVGSFQLTVTFMADGKKHQEVKVYYGKKLSPVPTVPSKKDDKGRPLAGEWCKDEDGNVPMNFYTEKITEDMTVYACYSEGRLVTLKTGAGYKLTAEEGSVSPVKLHGSFTFKFELLDGYEKTDKFAVKVNGVAVELTEDGTYTITDITEDQTVTVEGVKKKAGSGKPGGGTKPGDDKDPDDGSDPGDGTNPGDDTDPDDGTKPGDDKKPEDGTKPGDDEKPDDGTKPGDDKKPEDGTKPGGDTKPDDGTNPGDDTKPDDDTDPGDGTKPEDGVPPVSDDVPIIPGTIIDGKIVIDGGDITGGNVGEDGNIITGNLPGMAGAGSDPLGGTTGESTVSTMLKVGDGAVIVTVVCNGNCMAGVADTVAVANAALTPEQIELISGGKTIEIRIEVTDISGNVPPQDKEVIEDAAEANRDELPGLVAGMYMDISVFVRVGLGEWNAVTSTEEPFDVIIGIPEALREDGRTFYIIRSHAGEYALLNDMDTAPETVTISTDQFSSYAVVYQQTDEADGNTKCGLCHICPTFLGICCFIWLAVIAAVIVVVVIVILRRKKETDKA